MPPIQTFYVRTDNHNDHDYATKRIADSIAHLLQTHSEACAVHINEQNIHYSYNRNLNSNVATHKNSLATHALTNLINNHGNADNLSLITYLCFNLDFYKTLRTAYGNNSTFSDILKNLCQDLRYDIGIIRNNITSNNINDISNHNFERNGQQYGTQNLLQKYNTILETIRIDQMNPNLNYNNIDKSILLRPFQDIKKIHSLINDDDQNILDNFQQLVFTDNPNGFHAEINIYINHQNNVQYIGISKLSCGNCQLFFVKNDVNDIVRGGHGVIDNNWVEPANWQYLGNPLIQPQIIEINAPRPQQSDLSFDNDIEGNIETNITGQNGNLLNLETVKMDMGF